MPRVLPVTRAVRVGVTRVSLLADAVQITTNRAEGAPSPGPALSGAAQWSLRSAPAPCSSLAASRDSTKACRAAFAARAYAWFSADGTRALLSTTSSARARTLSRVSRPGRGAVRRATSAPVAAPARNARIRLVPLVRLASLMARYALSFRTSCVVPWPRPGLVLGATRGRRLGFGPDRRDRP